MIPLMTIQLAACSGNFPVYTSHSPVSLVQSASNDNPTSKYEQHDREFKIKDFDKESLTDKSGYIILGLAGAAITAAAIVLPFVLFK